MRSIITFPMLLQHVLRIWLHDRERDDLPKILDKELLVLFEKSFFVGKCRSGQVKSFIQLLWEIRYYFDKYVIKWVINGEEEHHLICTLRLNLNKISGKIYYSLARRQPNETAPLALLQSMLYHSQQITTHYWLTPLLAYIHHNPKEERKCYYLYLRHLDNHLFCGADNRPLIERSLDFLSDTNSNWQECQHGLDYSLLNQPLGTKFPHYWFYKLEFILWRKKWKEKNDPRVNTFRITARNSVEHISPQTQQQIDTNPVSKNILDTFGNLALVSRSINSEYGNLPFNEKRQRFLNRNNSRLDSLKMELIYLNDKWNDELAAQHQAEMIRLIRSYLKQNLQGLING